MRLYVPSQTLVVVSRDYIHFCCLIRAPTKSKDVDELSATADGTHDDNAES